MTIVNKERWCDIEYKPANLIAKFMIKFIKFTALRLKENINKSYREMNKGFWA